MRVCSPHCGINPESGSGGEVYERELLKDLARLGAECAVLLAAGKPHPTGVAGLVVHPVWPPKGLRWYVTPFVWPRYIKRLWDTQGFDVLRAHSVRYVGPGALWARRHYGLPVPVITHHHHLDPSPLNGVLERRVLAASDCVVTDSEFARRQLRDVDTGPLGKRPARGSPMEPPHAVGGRAGIRPSHLGRVPKPEPAGGG